MAVPLPDKVTDVPVQTVWSAPALTDGKEFIVTVEEVVFEQPLTSVTVTM